MKRIRFSFFLAALAGISVTNAIVTTSFGQYPDDCPSQCSDVGVDPVNWTRLHRLEDLTRCDNGILFSFNVQNLLTDPDTQVSVRACSYSGDVNDLSGSSSPQRRDGSADQEDPEQTISTTTSCGASVVQQPATPRMGSLGSTTVDISGDVYDTADLLATYLENGAECDATITFAKSGNAIVGLYSGAQIQKKSAAELVRSFQDQATNGGHVLELCQANTTAAETFGIFAGHVSDLGEIQGAVRTWANAECLNDNSLTTIEEVQVGYLAAADLSRRSLNARSAPQPDANGNCFTYTAQPDDGCWAIGDAFGITESDIESFNKKTWGWAGCGQLQLGQVFCLSKGDPPFPPEIDGAACGPQVPGTVKPTGGTDWASLNPCPLNACCDVWGFCGITDEFCTPSPADTGAPGTAKPNTNGCISNCGTDVVNNGVPPAEFRKVGYFEAFNMERPCLNLDITDMDTSKLTHIHFAFATVTEDFDVSVEAVKDQFAKYKDLETNAKKVLSFGGWTFSTGEDTFQLFRDATNADNRATFAANLVAFLKDNNLDGLDFDWEYPGAPDIPGVPPGSPAEATNYLEFLNTLKQIMPEGKSISVALPASFWYLQSYPVAWMQYFVDYFIYMTYDLHGQWDVENENVSPGCKGGNCLRSHVNITETVSAQSMITKAGVASNKIVVGITSYGRSFRMSDASCDGPMCTYTGTRNHSDAYKGRCTETAGYISNAELQEIIDGKSDYSLVRTSYDADSGSDILVYGTQDKADWVAYMSAATKNQRMGSARYGNFGGTTDWAVDLMEFVESSGGDDGGDDTCSKDDRTYSKEAVDPGSYYRWALMDPENAAASQKMYITIVNLTPHRFNLTSTHSYQMTTFDWGDIPSGRARQNVAEYDGSDTPVDDNGEAYYSIDGTDKTFFVRATTHIPDDHGYRTVFDLSGMGLGQREYKNPDAESPVTLVITGSDSYGFIASLTFGQAKANWMKGMYDVIKDRELRHLIMPGSHDAGMSTISSHLISGGTAANTQTQALNIYDQLRAGSRWFDLRVASIHQTTPNTDEYGFWVTHVNDELAEIVVGNTGEGLEQVISEINQFTEENPGEIIFFRVRYLVGLRRVPSLGPIYWSDEILGDFFSRLRTVKNRCGNLDAKNWKVQKASYFMDRNDGAGCVLFMLDTANLKDVTNTTAPSDGIYPASRMEIRDHWSEKEDTEPMAEDQVEDWNSVTRSATDDTFQIAQWLVTPEVTISTLYGLETLAILPTNPTLYWKGVNNMSPEKWPNVMMVDYFGVLVQNEHDWDQLGADLVTLAIGLNLYMVSENCDISGSRSPLLPSASSKMAKISTLSAEVPWNGIIYANGTRIDYPPPDLHVGRVEVLKNGTVFNNGTVLTVDVPNPDFNSTFS